MASRGGRPLLLPKKLDPLPGSGKASQSRQGCHLQLRKARKSPERCAELLCPPSPLSFWVWVCVHGCAYGVVVPMRNSVTSCGGTLHSTACRGLIK
eukprot:jgi/Botrbrau1/12868/Bobra.0188s0010.1